MYKPTRMKNSIQHIIGAFLVMALTVACEKTLPYAPMENEILDGPIDGLTTEEQAMFLRGDEAFSDVFTIAKGLGPIFVANQCASCHPGDGKGSPFVRFTRFGQPDTLGNHRTPESPPGRGSAHVGGGTHAREDRPHPVATRSRVPP